MRFQATFSFVVEGINTVEEATEYAEELAQDEMMTTGEEVALVEVELI